MCKKIAEWLLRNVKVSQKDVDEALHKCDTDGDGFYSLGEIVTAILEVVK